VFACLLVPAGALADRLGRKGTLLGGMALFGVGAALCAVAPDVPVLVAGRMLSGVGAAAVLPSTLALMVAGVPAERRPRRVAAWASMTGLAAVLGNVGGGAALSTGSWRAPFLAAVPLAALAVALVAALAPAVPRRPGRVDVPGAALLTTGVLALLYAVISAPRHGLGVPVVGGAVLAAVLLAGWVWHGLRGRSPLLDPRLFALPAVRAGAVGIALTFVGMFAVFSVNGQFLQYVAGSPPWLAGVRLLPMAAALLLAPRAGAALARLGGPRVAAGAGFATTAAGLAVLSTVDRNTGWPWYVAGAALTAVGCGLATPVLSDMLLGALPSSAAGTGSGLSGLARELGSALGVAVTGSLLTARLPPGVRDNVAAALATAPDRAGVLTAFTGALDAALRIVAVAVAAVGALVVAWLPTRAVPVRMPTPRAAPVGSCAVRGAALDHQTGEASEREE
ncbi:MAG TPA: MFS transporter, partial [Actinocatenispora sp.]